MDKLLRVKMGTGLVEFENVQEDHKYFGGRGLIAKIMNQEVDPKCDPLGPDNKLIICPGLLTGTTAPCSGRISIGSKSPIPVRLKRQMPVA